MSEDYSAHDGSQGDASQARHARRVSYRGSDDYVVSEVGSPETVRFNEGADLSGFDRMVIGHAADDITVETVGTSDPFAATPPENLTRPFTTVFPDGESPSETRSYGYSTFGDMAQSGGRAKGQPARSGETRPQQRISVQKVGDSGGEAFFDGSPSFDMPPEKGEGGEKKRRPLKAIIIAVVAVIAVCLGSFLWFTGALDGILAKSEGNASHEQLVTVPLDEPFYMLVLGIDARGVTDETMVEGGAYTDVMILVRIDAKEHVVTMVSIPRDTLYVNDEGSHMKINAAFYEGGASEAIKAVSSLTGVDISHYALVNFAQLQEIVDAVGGVDVYVDHELAYWDALTGEYISLQPGQQTLDGQQAQIFARARKDYEDDQDAHRQNNVRSLTEAVINKVLQLSPLSMPGTILNLANYVSTDLRSADFISLGMAFASNSGGMTVYEASGPTDGDFLEEYDGYWYCYPDPEGWARLMAVVDAGEDPSSVEF